ncbi:beta strand repeat-containing protein [Thalassoroseus pseudoceratinae]|uniref:beta strand repeat-containing protein n=1 Tax=Thalassoroseus pseudoceratinae TaxID=2713176 RepID=UPI00141F1C11|nr:choice-of-anchor D domain-containing protein [Thalassoroseus pseudoceratinae]
MLLTSWLDSLRFSPKNVRKLRAGRNGLRRKQIAAIPAQAEVLEDRTLLAAVINEVLFDPASGVPDGDANGDGVRSASGDEFVEVINTGPGTLDISGWTLSDDDGGDFTFPAGTILQENQALVLFGGGTPAGAFSDGSTVPAANPNFGNSLIFVDDGSIGSGFSNSGDLIQLIDAGSTVIDSVSYGSAAGQGLADLSGGSDQSSTRSPDLVGTFVDHVGADTDDGSRFSPGTRIDGSLFNAAGAPEINVQGMSMDILDGDTTPTAADGTDFGDVLTSGGSATQTFTIQNNGTADLTLGTINVTGANAADFVITQPATTTVASGGNVTFMVMFDPAADGVRNATINIPSDDADEDPYDFAVTGTGVAVATPEINVQGLGMDIVDGDTTPTTADGTDFGSTDSNSGMVTNTFTIQNTGTGGLDVTAITVTGANAGDFTIANFTAGVVSPSGTLTFDVIFDPVADGTSTATINIANDDTDENPYEFSVTGEGTSPPANLVAQQDFDGGEVNLVTGFDPSSDNLDGGAGDFFGVGSRNAWPQGFPNPGVPFSLADDTVFGYSSGTANPSDTEGIFGQNADLDNDYFALSDSDEFGTDQTASWTFDISGASNLGIMIDIGARMDSAFDYSDDTILTFTASIDGGTAQTLFSIAPVANNLGSGSLRPLDNGTNDDPAEVLLATGDAVITKEFAEGTTSTTAADLYLDKSLSADGSLDTFLTSIAGTGSNLTITFTANLPFEVAVFDNIIITGDAAVGPEIDVQGNAMSIPDGDTTPTTDDGTDFGLVETASGDQTQTFTILNTGSDPLDVSAINVTGANAGDFTITNFTAGSVAASGSTTFDVVFDPSADGVRNATISIVNDDADENPYDFAVTGMGVTNAAPEINVQGLGMDIVDGDTTPDSADGTDFGPTLTSNGMVTNTFTIQNTGTADLDVSAITVTGANAGDFTIANFTPGNVSSSGSITFDVVFDPAADGTSTATINIANDDADENPYEFAVTGTGLSTPVIVINEVDADTPSTDDLEFIELYDGGAGNTSLDGLVVVLFNGSDDASYDAIDLDGQSTDANGYFVIGLAGVPNVDLIPNTLIEGAWVDNQIQNGADAVALFVGNDTDFPIDTPVTATNLIDAVVYDTNDSDDSGLIDVLTPGQPQINESENGDSGNDAIARVPNGGTALDTSTYVTQTPTPGETNVLPTVSVDLEVTKSVDQTAILDGGTVTYTYIVTNNGPSDSTGATLDDTTTFDGTSFVISNAMVVFSGGGAGSVAATDDPDLTITALPSGATATVTFDVAVTGTGTLDNTVEVTAANEADPDSTPNDGMGDDFADADDVTVSALPALSIDDVTENEGNSGTTTYTFTVSLSVPAPVGGVTFDIATADDSATTADSDYVAQSLTSQTIAEGNTSYTFDVTVNGDTNVEPNESFFVNLSNVTGATVSDDQGVGTITNDDFPPLVINEFVFDHTSSDTNEFIELFGDASFDYSAFTILVIEGDGSSIGIIDDVIAVGSTDANGFFSTGYLNSEFENGTQTILLVTNFTGSEGDDLDTDNDGTLDSLPWAAVVDSVAIFDGGTGDVTYEGSTGPVLGPNFDGVSPFKPGGASRIPNGTDTDTVADWVRNNFNGAGLQDFPSATASAGEAISTEGTVNMVQQGIDLFVMKSVDNNDVTEGDIVTFTIEVGNTTIATQAATGVEVTDMLPADFMVTANTPSEGSFTPGTGVWTGIELAAGETATLTITGTFTDFVSSPYTNYVEVTAANETDPDSTPGNNSGRGEIGDPSSEDDDDSVMVTVAELVTTDLEVMKSDNADPIFTGETTTYTVTITNNGPEDVTGATLDDTIVFPSGMFTVRNASLVFSTPGATTGSGMLVEEADGPNITGLNLANGETATLTFDVTADTGTGTITNTATVSGGTPVDVNGLNDTAVETTTVNAPPSPLVINEFVFDHTGSDTDEFIEVFGDPNTDYSAFTILVIEGEGSGTGVIDNVETITTTDANGFFSTSYLNSEFENGTQTILIVENFTGSLNDDLDTNNDGILDSMPWTSVVDSVAVFDGDAGDVTYEGSTGAVLGPNFDGVSPFEPGGASRIPNGTDTDTSADWVRNDFGGAGLPSFPSAQASAGVAINTKDAVNIVQQGIDLEVSISVDNDDVLVGETITFTIETSNTAIATQTATGVELTEVLSDDFVLTMFNASEGSFDPNTDIWSGLELDAGETQTLTITGSFIAATDSPYENYVQVTAANEVDPDSTPNNGTAPTPAEDDEAATTVVVTEPDVVPPTLDSADIVDDRSGGPIAEGTLVTYTLTFSEDIDDSTVDAADFTNAGTAPITIGAITETSPGVFTVEVTPTAPGTLILQMPVVATIDDVAGNSLVPPVEDDTTITVTDATAPTLDAADIVDDQSGGPITEGTLVTYTVTFNEDIDESTVDAADFTNAGTASITIGAITETNPGVFTVEVTPTAPGTLILQVPVGATIDDPAGNSLVPPVDDDTTITVTDGTAPTLAPVDIVDDRSGGPIAEGTLVTYTLTFSEDIDDSTVDAADFTNAGTAPITIGAITETSPGVFTVEVTPTASGMLILQVPVGATIDDVAGNSLVPPVNDDTTITVSDVTAPTLASADIVDDQSGGPIAEGTLVTYTVTFSEDINENTVGVADFTNAGSAPITVGTITETSPGVFNIEVMPTAPGTLILEVSSAATIDDPAGNSLVPPIQDDTTITVTDATAPLLDAADIVDDQSGGPIIEGTLVTYTVTFSEDIDDGTVDAADFRNAGTSPITIGVITETSPGVFTVEVTPTAPGTLILQVPNGATINDVAGNSLTTPVDDDTTITVTATPEADLMVTTTNTIDPIITGGTTTYTVTITNSGPDDVTGASLDDSITFPTGTFTVGNESLSFSGSGSGSLVIEADGPNITDLVLANGETATLTFDVTAETGVGPITNTATVSGGSPADPDTANNSTVETTIVEAPPITKVEFSNATNSDLETSGGNQPVLLVNGTLTEDQTVDVIVTGGTAIDDTDFTLTETVTIPAGVYDGTNATAVSIGLTIMDDAVVELDETIELALANPTGNLVINDTNDDTTTQATTIYTVTNDDAATLSIDDVTDFEGTSGTRQLVFTVTLDNDVETGLTVDFDTVGDTATATDGDYVANIGNALTFSGTAGETQTLTVLINGDTDREADESFFVELSNIQAGGRDVTLSDAQGVGVIVNDDLAPNIADLTDANIDPIEINGPFTLTVSGNFDNSPSETDATADDLFFWDPASGANRIVFGDGSVQDNPFAPTDINGNDFTQVRIGDFDNDAGHDLFFWNPSTGRNRLIHANGGTTSVVGTMENNVVPVILVNGNDFEQFVVGNFDDGGPEDLFFWNPVSGANRLVHFEVVTPGMDTDFNNQQTNVIAPSWVNGDFEIVLSGQFLDSSLDELLFVNLQTGQNRLVSLTAVTPGTTTNFDSADIDFLPVTLFNGNDYDRIEIGDLNGDGLDDVFAWNTNSGDNRTALTNLDPNGEAVPVDNVVNRLSINGDFEQIARLTEEVFSDELADEFFFWNPQTGQNRTGFLQD